MGYHAGVSWLPGGLLGVDVFFVLSGFLITSLLLTEQRNTGQVSLSQFWARRARRLLPAMALLLIAMIAWAAYLSPPTSRTSLRGDAFATLGYVANWRFILSGQGYFDHFGPQSPLLHTWSVAVEEQFYLVWPLLLVILWHATDWRQRRRKPAVAAGAPVRSAVFTAALVGAIGSAVLMAVLSLNAASQDRLYYGTDTRALPLLLGCCLAALRTPDGFRAGTDVRRSDRRLCRTQSTDLAIQLAGLAGIAVLVIFWTSVSDRSQWLYRGGFALVAVAAVAVVLSCADAARGPVARLLSVRPLCYIGEISYGLYLFHWPVFQWLTYSRTGWRGPGLLCLRFAVTLAVAIASYHLLEQPIRRGALNRTNLSRYLHLPRPLTAAALPSMCLILVAALIVGLTVTTQVSNQQLAAGATAGVPAQQPPPPPEPPRLTPKQTNALNRPIRVLLEGDSLAFTMGYDAVSPLRRQNIQLYDLGRLGCGIARGGSILTEQGWIAENSDCKAWPTWRADDVAKYDPDVVILLVGRWEVVDRTVSGITMHVGQAAYDQYLSRELDLAIKVLSQGGAHVVLATTPYFEQHEDPSGAPYDFDDPSRVSAFNQLLRQAAARAPQTVSVLDLNSFLGPSGSYQATVRGTVVRTADGVHISADGSRLVADLMAPELLRLGGARRDAQASDSRKAPATS